MTVIRGFWVISIVIDRHSYKCFKNKKIYLQLKLNV